MQVSYRRTDKPDESVIVHVVDGATKRGLRLQSHGSWSVVSAQDLGEKVAQHQVGEFFIDHEYVPVTVPDAEFDKLYRKARAHSALLRSDFDPSEAPTLQKLVEETRSAYAERLAHLATPHGC